MVDRKNKAIFVGIAGGTASGKTTVTENIFQKVRVGKEYEQCCMIPLDCFYKECTDYQMQNIANVNFDHPEIFDWDLLKQTLQQLKDGNDVVIPDYDYKTCKRNPQGIVRKWSPLIIFEGIFALLDKDILETLDFKIFVLTDDDVRLARRIQRDIIERKRTIQGVLRSYHRFVKPAHTEFVKPTMRFADLIVPRERPLESSRNQVAIDFIVQNLEHKLISNGFNIHNQVKINNQQLDEQVNLLLNSKSQQWMQELVINKLLSDLIQQIQKHNNSKDSDQFNNITFTPIIQYCQSEQSTQQIWALFEQDDSDVKCTGSLIKLEVTQEIQDLCQKFDFKRMFNQLVTN